MNNSNEGTTVLVTGGSGFVGVHCILQLLKSGYAVKTTLRSMNRKQEVLDMLQTGGLSDLSRLSFVEADLMNDTNWDLAVKGCKYVLHVASPIFLKLPKYEDEMIRPAVEGTLRVLKASREAGVKRVVMTSSFGAIGYSVRDPKAVITEKDWTDPKDGHLSAYLKSKTLAERAAWDFMSRQGGSMELTVINPMAIFGPSLGPAMSSGFELLKQVMDGSMKAIPNISLGIVDVRDVAALHLLAMTSPNGRGERFLALAGGVLTLPQIAQLLKTRMPAAAKNVSEKVLPDWVVKLAAIFNAKARQVAPQVGRTKNASNAKAKTLLGWTPKSNEEAVLAAAESLIRFNNVHA